MISKRLKQLRLAKGLSLDALVAEMGGLVTKQALSKYELGKSKPTPSVLTKLASALGVKAVHLWSEPSLDVRFIAYRKGSGLPRKSQVQVEAQVSQDLEERVRLQNLTNQHDGNIPIQSLKIKKVADAEDAAEQIRSDWNLGLDPIYSVSDVLEDHFVHVLEVESGEKFDGISAVAYNDDGGIEAAAVATRKGVPGERQRLNLGHELGHLILKVPAAVDEEKAAFRFAAAFLAPADTIFREVGSKRASIQLAELLLLKQKLGMSIQALIYRLHDLGIITDSYCNKWWITINRLGMKKQERGELAPERPQWLRRTVLRAFSEGLIVKDEAESMIGEIIQTEEALSLIGRRAFMQLSKEERRKILESQAEKAKPHYAQDKDRDGLQGGDFIEYDKP
jgi:transcriptional regulator with XRE-family HTH domain